MQTFSLVKDVFQSQALRNFRQTRLFKALSDGKKFKAKVVLTYDSDEMENNKVSGVIDQITDDRIALSNNQLIPVRAVRHVSYV